MNEDMTPERLETIKGQFVLMKEQLQHSLDNLDQELGDGDQLELKIKGQLWVVEGFLENNLSLHRLENVLKTYQRIGLVPQGYN